jgi:phage host-nuclease inhibitor protein Gam
MSLAKMTVGASGMTREAAERVVGEIARLTIQADALRAEMDDRLRTIRGEYEPRLVRLQDEVDRALKVVKFWADENPEAFGGRKSLELIHGTVGWRTGQPTLRTLSGWTWERVKEALAATGMLEWIRTKSEVDREGIIAARASFGADGLRAIGLRVTQAETFFVEPKREPPVEATAKVVA